MGFEKIKMLATSNDLVIPGHDPLIKEYFPMVNSCEFLWRLDKGPIKTNQSLIWLSFFSITYSFVIDIKLYIIPSYNVVYNDIIFNLSLLARPIGSAFNFRDFSAGINFPQTVEPPSPSKNSI